MEDDDAHRRIEVLAHENQSDETNQAVPWRQSRDGLPVLGRTRDIGLRRAMGTTRGGVQRFFVGQALHYSVIGSIAGTGVAFGLYRTIGQFLTPLFDSAGFRASDIALTVPGVLPVVIAVGSALVFGVLFGFFPAISAAKMPIAECLREDAV